MNNSRWKSEAQFQSECFKWFDRTYPEQRGRLIGIYNNPPNEIVGSLLTSMGIRKGVSDFLYFPQGGYRPQGDVVIGLVYHGIRLIRAPHWIELKIANRTQSASQEAFEEKIKSFGHDYSLIKEQIEDFQNLISNINLIKP